MERPCPFELSSDASVCLPARGYVQGERVAGLVVGVDVRVVLGHCLDQRRATGLLDRADDRGAEKIAAKGPVIGTASKEG